MPDEISILVQNLRQDVERYKGAMLQAGLAANGSLCTCDLFFWFIAKRSAAITSAFADAIQQRNHFVSPALVRMQLSSLLGLYAAQCHEQGPHEFVEDWMKGKAMSQMRDNGTTGGQLMRDGHLLKRIDDELPDDAGSIEELYGMASGWVHLDPKFFHALTQSVGEKGQVQFLLYGPEYEIPHLNKDDERNWSISMLSINNLMMGRLLMWAACKQNVWGGLTSDDFEMSPVKINQPETVIAANGLEAVLLDRGEVDDGERFLLWVNAVNPKRNLAYVGFPKMEQANTFANWYFQNLSDASTQSSQECRDIDDAVLFWHPGW